MMSAMANRLNATTKMIVTDFFMRVVWPNLLMYAAAAYIEINSCQVQILHKSLQINTNSRSIYAAPAYIEIQNSPGTPGAAPKPQRAPPAPPARYRRPHRLGRLGHKLPPMHFGSPKCTFTLGANCPLPFHRS